MRELFEINSVVIFIAPIGSRTNFVKTWLSEESRPVHKLWLIHSEKNKEDYPLIAKKLESDLHRSYDRLEINKKKITNALSVDPTIDAIYEIILTEENLDPSLIRQDFAINITGGTNAMGAAALLAATLYGTKAFYVREPQKGDSQDEKYVDELPVLPIGKAKLNKNQLTVLKIIAESKYEIAGGPPGLDRKQVDCSISRRKLLEKLKWKKKGNTRLEGITKRLIEANLLIKIPYIETYENKASKRKTILYDGYSKQIYDDAIPDDWKIVRNEREVRFEATPAGKRQARDAMMF